MFRYTCKIQQRYCERNNLPIYILEKGDPDAGVVIIKINLLDGTCKVFSQIVRPNGEPAWQSWSANGVPVLESNADAYILDTITINDGRNSEIDEWF